MPDRLSSRSPVRAPLEELKEDQRRRWSMGVPQSLETYLEQHPEVDNHPGAVVELIYNEVLLRERHGETPRPEDYTPRFPHLSEEIALQFQAHAEHSTAGAKPLPPPPPPPIPA